MQHSVPFLTAKDYWHTCWAQTCANRTSHLSAQQKNVQHMTNVCKRGPHESAKELYTSAKEPCESAKEPYESTNTLPSASFVAAKEYSRHTKALCIHKRALQKRLYSANETYNLKEPTNRSSLHPPKSHTNSQIWKSALWIHKRALLICKRTL